MKARNLVVSFAAITLLIIVAGPSGESQAQAYGQDEVCADRCRGGMTYCMGQCYKPLTECTTKCDIDPKHKSPKLFSDKENACVKSCQVKMRPCTDACGKQRSTCFSKCQL